jgi:hypothetical protein
MAPHPGPFDPVGERIEESMSMAARARTRARATRDIERGGDGGSEPRALPPVAVLRSAGSSAMDLPIAEATEYATAAVLSRSVGDINRASSLPVAEAQLADATVVRRGGHSDVHARALDGSRESE